MPRSIRVHHTILFGANLRNVLLLLLMIVAALAAADGQNRVPQTAREAATMPKYAQRLRHAALPVRPRPASRPSNILYENGPLNGNTNGWVINFGFVTSNTFYFDSTTTVGGFDFYVWAFPGDQMLTVDWSITSEPNGGTVYASGTAAVFQSFLFNNDWGYDIDRETVSLVVPVLIAPGTVWLNLQNAIVNSESPIYWDENSGIGCQSPGCPSQAWFWDAGTIPSEAFEITDGSGGGCSPEAPVAKPVRQAHTVVTPLPPAQLFQVIHQFGVAGDGVQPATGLAMDSAGALYGTTRFGGRDAGTVFRLLKTAQGWKFDRLHAFNFADGRGPDSRLVIDSNGSLYGATVGGGPSDYGTVFQLRVGGRVPPCALCEWWNENLLYNFAGGEDGANPTGDILMDQAGDIYGVTGSGASGHGTIYRLTNSTKILLHQFGGPPGDGSLPRAGLVAGLGGFYGTTTAGGACGLGIVYQLAQQESVLYSFLAQSDGAFPLGGLVSDNAGNLYGTTRAGGAGGGGTVFVLSYPDWTLTTLYSFSGNASPEATLTMDSQGNLYGTTVNGGAYGQGNVFKLARSGDSWTYTSLHDFNGADGAQPKGSVLVDSSGNLYGTASLGGQYGAGVVWEITP